MDILGQLKLARRDLRIARMINSLSEEFDEEMLDETMVKLDHELWHVRDQTVQAQKLLMKSGRPKALQALKAIKDFNHAVSYLQRATHEITEILTEPWW